MSVNVAILIDLGLLYRRENQCIMIKILGCNIQVLMMVRNRIAWNKTVSLSVSFIQVISSMRNVYFFSSRTVLLSCEQGYLHRNAIKQKNWRQVNSWELKFLSSSKLRCIQHREMKNSNGKYFSVLHLSKKRVEASRNSTVRLYMNRNRLILSIHLDISTLSNQSFTVWPEFKLRHTVSLCRTMSETEIFFSRV